MEQKNTAETVFFTSAQAELRTAISFLQKEIAKAEKYRGKDASTFWKHARGLAIQAITFVSDHLTPSSLIVVDNEAKESVADTIYRMHLGFEVYQDQFSRVQWLVTAAEELRDRLIERELIQTQHITPTVEHGSSGQSERDFFPIDHRRNGDLWCPPPEGVWAPVTLPKTQPNMTKPRQMPGFFPLATIRLYV